MKKDPVLKNLSTFCNYIGAPLLDIISVADFDFLRILELHQLIQKYQRKYYLWNKK